MVPLLCTETARETTAGLHAPDPGAARRHERPEKPGVHHVFALNSHYTEVKLDFPVSLGAYRHSRSPEEPIVLHLERSPCRAELLATSFEAEERKIRDQLARMLRRLRSSP